MISSTCRRAKSAAVPCVMSYLFLGAAPLLGGVSPRSSVAARRIKSAPSPCALDARLAPRRAALGVPLRRGAARAADGLSAHHSRRHWSERGVAAVHHHGRAGDVARLRRREENDGLGDLARLSGPAQRCQSEELL